MDVVPPTTPTSPVPLPHALSPLSLSLARSQIRIVRSAHTHTVDFAE